MGKVIKRIDLYRKLHGSDDKGVCKRTGCRTITLADYCQKHKQVRQQAVAGEQDEKTMIDWEIMKT
jgi:hypothetical protein